MPIKGTIGGDDFFLLRYVSLQKKHPSVTGVWIGYYSTGFPHFLSLSLTPETGIDASSPPRAGVAF
jgi:hypothetical protein